MNEQGYAHRVQNEFRCVSCGYVLRGVDVDGHCPECGTPVRVSFSTGLPASGAAIAGMVLGIISVIGCMGYGIPSLICGPLAIYFSRVGQKQVREGSAARSSGGMATAGLVTGIIGTCFAGFWVILFVIGFLGLMAGSGAGFGP